MNVVEINGIWPPRNTTTNITSNNNSNSIQSDAQPTSHWRLRSYWRIAVPLAIGTILFPLVVGPTFRTVAQFAVKNRIYWRIIFALALSTIVIVVYWIPSSESVGYGLIMASLNLVMEVTVLLFSCLKIYSAMRPLQWNKVRKWVVFIIFTFPCFFIDIPAIGPIMESIFGFLPYVILFVGWILPHAISIQRVSRKTT